MLWGCREMQRRADGRVDAVRDPGDDCTAAVRNMQQRVRAELLDHFDGSGKEGLGRGAREQVLRTDADGYGAPACRAAVRPTRRATAGEYNPAGTVSRAGQKVHRRRADETGDELCRRVLVDFHRGADLLVATG